MTLSFFRRHRTLFMVLMALGVVGFVLFGTFPFVRAKIHDWVTPKQPAGTIDGRKVLLIEVYDLYSNLKVAAESSRLFGIYLVQKVPEGEGQRRLAYLIQGMTSPYAWQAAGEREIPIERRMAWYAVWQEAVRLGFEAPKSQVQERLKQFRDLGLTTADYQRILMQTCGGDEQRLETALRTDMTILAYQNWVGEQLSQTVDPELRKQFVQMDEQIKVRVAVLAAKDYEKEAKEPGEEAVLKQFNAYKKYLPGQGPEGFGYMIPDRVSIEYLVSDPKTFDAEARKAVTDADVKAYYEEHKDTDFVVKEEKKDAKDEKKDAAEKDKDKEKDKAAEKDKEKPAEKKIRPLSEVRDEIVTTLAAEKARKLALEALASDVAEVRTKKHPDLDIWADGVHVKHVKVDGLFTADQLGQLKGIGSAQRGRETLPQVALSLAELMAERAKARLAVGEISDVFTSAPDGTAYAFRATGCDPRHEPKLLTEVAEAVKTDLRLVEAYQTALAKAKALEEAAETKGFETAAKDAKVETAESNFFPREVMFQYGGQVISLPPQLPKVGGNPVVVAACFRMVADGKKLTTVPLPRERNVVVAELADRQTPREAAFDQERERLDRRIGQDLGAKAFNELFSVESVSVRHKIVVDPSNLVKGKSRDTGKPEEDANPDLY